MEYRFIDLIRALRRQNEELTPCSKCGGAMIHLVGQECSGQAVALFECSICSSQEHRGGCGSEVMFERLYHIRKYFGILPFYRQYKVEHIYD